MKLPKQFLEQRQDVASDGGSLHPARLWVERRVHSQLMRRPAYATIHWNARFLLVRSLRLVDDYGRFTADINNWTRNVGIGQWPIEEVDGYLKELVSVGFLVPYEVAGNTFFYLPDWHQPKQSLETPPVWTEYENARGGEPVDQEDYMIYAPNEPMNWRWPIDEEPAMKELVAKGLAVQFRFGGQDHYYLPFFYAPPGSLRGTINPPETLN